MKTKDQTLGKCLIWFIFLGTTMYCNAQYGDVGLRYNNWYFGYNSALTWNPSGVPTSLTDNAMSTEEGCATISDVNGNLLFYTNGMNVWNSSHSIVASGLFGGASSSQAALIIPKPLTPNSYYIFTTPDWGVSPPYLNGAIYYREVTVTGTTVTVEPTDHSIYSDTHVSEKITATCVGNGPDIWVISHAAHSDTFIFIRVTAAGPVLDHIQQTGLVYGPDWYNSPGQLKVDLDGNQLAITTPYGNRVEVYDFNNVSGQLSNLRYVFSPPLLPWGVEFSPSGNLLYVGNINTSDQLQQFAITPLELSLSYTASTDDPQGLQSLQLQTDNKIYAQTSESHVDIINQPDQAGVNCDFVHPGIPIQYFSWDPNWHPSGLANNTWVWCSEPIVCDSCENPIRSFHTGAYNNWNLFAAPSGVTSGTPDVLNNWTSYNLTQPIEHSQWIGPSGSTPNNNWPIGYYDYRCSFSLDPHICPSGKSPSVKMCIKADSATIYLNNHYIGQSQSKADIIEFHLDPDQYLQFGNTLNVILNNPAGQQPFIDVKIWICCSDNPNSCDSTIHCGQLVSGLTTENKIDEYIIATGLYGALSICPGNEAVYCFNVPEDPSIGPDTYKVTIESCPYSGIDLRTIYFILTDLPQPPSKKVFDYMIKAEGGHDGILSPVVLGPGLYYIIVDSWDNSAPPHDYFYCFTVKCDPYLPWDSLPHCHDMQMLPVVLNSGNMLNPDSLDPYWRVWPFPDGTLKQARVIPWQGIPNWGPPQEGTNWISYMDYPPVSNEVFGFVNEFFIPDTCTSPWLKLSVMGDYAEIELNGRIIGTCNSQTIPTLITNSYDLHRGSMNTIKVFLYNKSVTAPGINIRGEVCSNGGQLGVPTQSEEKPYVLYPNPVRDQLFLETKENITQLSIFSSLGELVFGTQLIPDKMQIDIGNLKQGMYFVKIQTEQGFYSEKVIILR